MRGMLLLLVVVGTSCFSTKGGSGDDACTPGDQKECPCPDGSQSAQVCLPSGEGYDACMCGGDTDTTTATTMSTDSASSTSTTDGTTTTDGTSTTTEGTSGSSGTTGSGSTSGVSGGSTSGGTTSTTGSSGSTGGGSTGGAMPDVVINEVLHDPPNMVGEDWIELYNRGNATQDLSGWTISDGGNQFIIPNGTTLDADSYLTYTRGEPGSFTFGFGDIETAILRDAANAIVDSTAWGAGEGVQPFTWGRSPNGTGNFTNLSPTKNAPNP